MSMNRRTTLAHRAQVQRQARPSPPLLGLDVPSYHFFAMMESNGIGPKYLLSRALCRLSASTKTWPVGTVRATSGGRGESDQRDGSNHDGDRTLMVRGTVQQPQDRQHDDAPVHPELVIAPAGGLMLRSPARHA